jgi:ATP-dependent Lon protease
MKRKLLEESKNNIFTASSNNKKIIKEEDTEDISSKISEISEENIEPNSRSSVSEDESDTNNEEDTDEDVQDESDINNEEDTDEEVQDESDINNEEDTEEVQDESDINNEEDIEDKEDTDDDEYDPFSVAKSYGFSEEEAIHFENMEEEDIEALSKLKKMNEKIYNNFITSKEIIKGREITIMDIINAEIPNEKRANLIEQFECFKQMFPCTEEYLLLRDRIRNMYINYISEYGNIESIVSNKKIKFVESESVQFKRKIKDLNCSDNNKRILEEKLEEFEDTDKGDEKSKLKRWLTMALSLPFNNISNNNIDNVSNRIKETGDFLNKRLYGMKIVKERLLLFLNKKLRESNSRGCNIALVGKPGVGKCLHPDTPVIMYDLSVKLAKEVKVGDVLLGDDCTKREVLSIANGKEEMFRVFQEFGQEYVVNKSHILTLKSLKENKVVDIPLVDVLNNQDDYTPVCCKYDGFIFNSNAKEIGRFMGSNLNNDNSHNVYNKNIIYIPQNYKLWNLDSKFSFLQGLIDTSEIVQESIEKKSINIYIHKNKPIFTILDLLRSAGIRCIYENNFLKIRGEISEKIHIQSIGEGEYYGFTVSDNERFVLGDWTVTHNTAIAKALSECLKIPFSQLSFGGVNNSEFLIGHDYTYIGSRPGEITRCMMRMGAKNGIIFLDEFDKASDKKDVMSALLHITDFSQNNEFRDNYFPELTQDLSKIWFIYSMNELPTDPAMLDRLEVIKVEDYTILDRIEIAKNYLFPKYLSELSIMKDTVILSDCGIKKIVDYSSGGMDKKGVRDLERFINIIIEKIYFYLSNIENDYDYEWFKKMKSCYNKETKKIIINESLVQKVLEDFRKTGDDIFLSMYM